MIKFDFNKYINNFISNNDKTNLIEKKDNIIKKFYSYDMIGWIKDIDKNLIEQIISLSKKVKETSSCLVVIGIGGSFLGSLAVKEMLKNYYKNEDFKIIYAGTTLSSKQISELLEYLKTIDFTINVISKSGTTMETSICYDLIKELMIKKYSKEELKNRIIITTDKIDGNLRKEVIEKGYESFEIPNDIGGRYSIVTPAHLFPLAFNIDIKEFINGLKNGKNYIDNAYEYACIRNILYNKGKVVENYVIYEENMYYFTEWLKQLFGESEGKDEKGILPISTIHTRDLHSLGQFIQEGNKIIFETIFKVTNSNILKYKNTDIHTINNIVLNSVQKAHFDGGVPSNTIEIDNINEYTIGEMMMFFMLSAALSSILFSVNPFNQPGVEIYKKEVKNNLNTLN